MKLLDIVKSVGSSVIRNAVPGGALLVDVVNGFLPDDEKLPSEATGSDISAAVGRLPAEEQAKLLNREFDVDITQIKESNDTLRAMIQAEQSSTHTTRPRIALGAFRLVAFVSILVVATWSYAIIKGNKDMVSAVVDGWPFIAAVVGPFVTLLWAYFGILKQEYNSRINAATGSTSAGVSGILANMLKR